MATYIKGLTDYIPQVQPWEPDYNFYQNSLERKQQSYDKGWEQTNSLYNSILNAPMMREQNIQRRDNFFQSIEGQIQQLSGVDLSLAQNVDSASQIFKPFYEDDNIVHDIAFTKNYRDEMQKAEAFRNCTDEKKCGGKYWNGGVRAMQYKAQEFVNASDNAALNMSAPQYTPYVNFMEKAQNAVKEAGFKMVQDEIKGGYKVTTQNGEQVIAPLQQFMMSRFGDDPALNAYNTTRAYLLRKENPEEAINIYEMQALKGRAKSEEELKELVQDKVDKSKFEGAVETITKTAAAEKGTLEALIERKAMVDKVIQEGVLPDSDEIKTHAELTANIPIAEAAVDKANKAFDSIKNLQYIDSEGNKISENVLDQVVANALMMNDIGQASTILAYKDYSQTMKADEYALANYKNNLGIKRDMLKTQGDLSSKEALATIKYIRERRDEGDRQFMKKAKYIDNLMIDKGYSAVQALEQYRKDFPTGITYYDGVTDYEGKVSIEGAKQDLSLVKASDLAESTGNLEDGKVAADVWNEKIFNLHQDAEVNKLNYENTVTPILISNLTNVIRTSLNPKDANNIFAYGGIKNIGDKIHELESNDDPRVAALKKSGDWNKYFKNFPSNSSKGSEEALINLNDNSEAIQKIVGLLGIDEVTSLFETNQSSTVITSPISQSLIDMTGVITPEQAAIIKLNPNATEEEELQLKEYQHKTDINREIQTNNYMSRLLTVDDNMKLAKGKWLKDNSEGMFKSLGKQLTEARDIFAGEVDEEDNNVITKEVRKNILQKSGESAAIADPAYIFTKIAEGGVDVYNAYDKHNITTGFGTDVLSLEEDYLKDGSIAQFKNESLKGLLQTASMPAINPAQLVNPQNLMTEGQDVFSGKKTGSMTLDKAWQKIMEDPKTKVLRIDDKIRISSPHFKGGKSEVIDLGDVGVDDGIQNMFNDAEGKYAKSVAGYTERLQQTGGNPENLVYGANFGSESSDFNYTAKSIKGMKLIPNDPAPSYDDALVLLEEGLEDIGTNWAEYGLNNPTGDPKFLEQVVGALKKNYDKEDSKKMPSFTVDYNPAYGNENITKVTIKTNEPNKQAWLSAIGEQVTGLKTETYEETGGTYKGSNMQTVGTYYIKNSKSPMILKSKPNAFNNILNNLKEGGSYVDDSQYANTKSYTEYKRENGVIKIYQTVPYYDADSKRNGTFTELIDTKPIKGPDWESIVMNNTLGLHVYKDNLQNLYKDQGILVSDPSQK